MPLHILTICDDLSFGTRLCEMLTAQGHTACCVPEGKEAFRAIRLDRPDLIIVDVEADKVGGLASVQRLQTPAGPCTIPVIVISDCPGLEAELLHVFDFLSKPPDLNRLLDDVAAICARPAAAVPRSGLSDRHYQEFSSLILCRTGLQFEARNRFALERGLRKRMSALRLDSYADYLAFLKLHGTSRQELQKLLQFLTVGETYFFRYPAHFDALKDGLSAAGQRIRIWSAGCSTGEEPYSIAISVMETLPDWRSRDIRIIASDINSQSIKRARDGVYSPWSLRGTDQRIRERYFERDGEDFRLKEEVKRLVQFSQLNLSCDCGEEMPRELDAIFCRNVMIYFPAETAVRLVGKFAGALKPKGLLFLGHAETLLQRSPELEIRRRDSSFYYGKIEPERGAGTPAPALPGAAPPAPTPLPSQPAPLRVPAASCGARLARVQQLLDAQQPALAEELLDGLLADCPEETGALVLKGFLLVGKGQFPEALELCRRALGLNDLLAEAYFLKGVVLDASGRLAEAANEYRKALLLDHDFIMPRYYMGRIHLRLGRGVEAAREIRNSLRILDRRADDGALPYSGGLTRSVCKVLLNDALAQVG